MRMLWDCTLCRILCLHILLYSLQGIFNSVQPVFLNICIKITHRHTCTCMYMRIAGLLFYVCIPPYLVCCTCVILCLVPTLNLFPPSHSTHMNTCLERNNSHPPIQQKISKVCTRGHHRSVPVNACAILMLCLVVLYAHANIHIM